METVMTEAGLYIKLTGNDYLYFTEEDRYKYLESGQGWRFQAPFFIDKSLLKKYNVIN
ncbi:MAG: hypothetical protein AAB067_05485 [Planctomycetota bacterium]